MNEEVKKILKRHQITYQGVDFIPAAPSMITVLAMEICQLFEKDEPKQDNWICEDCRFRDDNNNCLCQQMYTYKEMSPKTGVYLNCDKNFTSCKCYEPKPGLINPDKPYCGIKPIGKPGGCEVGFCENCNWQPGMKPKPNEDGLLTDEEILEASQVDMFLPNGELDPDCGYLRGRQQVAKAQRDLTASNKEGEHYQDMFKLQCANADELIRQADVKEAEKEELLKLCLSHIEAEKSAKDAEIAKLNQKLALDYVIDLVKRAKGDFLGLPDGEQEFIGKLAKELWDIKKIDAEYQERVERIFRKMEDYFLGIREGKYTTEDTNIWWQALRKEEGL